MRENIFDTEFNPSGVTVPRSEEDLEQAVKEIYEGLEQAVSGHSGISSILLGEVIMARVESGSFPVGAVPTVAAKLAARAAAWFDWSPLEEMEETKSILLHAGLSLRRRIEFYAAREGGSGIGRLERSS